MIKEITLDDGSTIKVQGMIPKLSATPGLFKGGGPKLGEYTEEVLRLHGLQAHDLERLKSLDNALSRTGVSKIETTSFTSPKAIPTLRDAEELMQAIERRPGVKYTCLVPNMRGAMRAMQCSVDEINLVMSTSETHIRQFAACPAPSTPLVSSGVPSCQRPSSLCSIQAYTRCRLMTR